MLKRARGIFEMVVDLPAGERLHTARSLCGGDADLYELVVDLLGVDEAPSVLDTSTNLGMPVVLAAELKGFGLPSRVGSYEVLGEIGRGGMGVVYEARPPEGARVNGVVLPPIVALKTLQAFGARAALDEQFLREASATSRVEHPGIPRVYEVIRHAGSPVMVMDRVYGSSLAEATEHRTQHARVELLIALCETVQAAHDAGVVHRDLKPSNVLVTEAGEPRVLDFGIASRGGDTIRGSGTLAYAAPEQLDGVPTDGRVDVYAIGGIAWEVLLRERLVPDDAAPMDVFRIKAAPANVPSGRLPHSLAQAIESALAVEPADRPPTPAALADALRRALA